MSTRHTVWHNIIQANNLHELSAASTIFSKEKLKRAVQWAISDSGATGHFLVENAPVTNKQVATHLITTTLPNGRSIKSTHTCNLDIPWLPHAMTETHIVPGLAHSSLISTRKFCDAGCKVSFDMDECRVYFKGQLVSTGNRDPIHKLW